MMASEAFILWLLFFFVYRKNHYDSLISSYFFFFVFSRKSSLSDQFNMWKLMQVSLFLARCMCVLTHVWFFATLWTVALGAPLSMGFSRQEYWSRLPFSSPGDPPILGIKPMSPPLAGGFFTTIVTWEALMFFFTPTDIVCLHFFPPEMQRCFY